MLRRLAAVLALIPAFWLAPALALGLGDIDVRSTLNQRFAATIPVIAANAEELEGLEVKMATSDDFARAGVERSDYLSTLEFALVPGAGGTQVRISSRQITRDPFLNFIVEARGRGGRLLREYTVLLDPPSASQPEPAVVAPIPAPVPSRTPAAPAPLPRAAAAPARPAAATPAPVAEASAAAGSYGPVQPSETLWSIANKLRGDTGATVDQMLLALYQANPRAFEGGFNGLRKGSRLVVPGAAEIKSVDPVTAKSRVAELRAGGASSATTPVNPAPVASPAPSESPPAAASPPPAAAPAVVSPAPPISAPAAAAPSAPVAAGPAPPAAASPAPSAETPATAGAAPETPTPAPETPAPAAAETSPLPVVAPPVEAPVAPAPAPPNAGFPGDYLAPLIGVLVVLLLSLLAYSAVQRRRKTAEAASAPALPPMLPRVSFDRPVAAAPVVPVVPKLEPTLTTDDRRAAMDAAAPTVIAPPPPPSLPAVTSGAEADFDRTESSEAQTLSMNLDSNDPLTEADFHLAYGLYDEAAQMLKTAADRNPGRLELRTKLAETYFKAGKPVEFQETAESLYGQVSDPEWEKLAGFGRAICPDVELFKRSSEPAFPSYPGAQTPVVEPPPPELSVIDFDFDSELAAAEPATASSAAGGGLDFDLSHFDLGEDAPAALTDPNGQVDFHLDELDLSGLDAGTAEAPLAAGDEVDTKLDLARAYADMGDNDAARSLLAEVQQAGSEAQKREADALQQRLSA